MNRRIICALAVLAALTVVSVALAAGPASTTAPKLVGAVQFDKTVTCDPGAFSPAPASISYSWAANGGPIVNQTSSKLTIDIPYLMGGYNITCSVTATDAAGATTTVTTPAVRPAPGASTLKILSVSVKKKGAFVIKGQIGPAHLIAKYAKGSDIVLNRKAPGAKAVYQLSDGSTTVNSKGRFTITGHDKAGKRAVIVNYYPGHDGAGIWAPASVTRTIKVSSGFTGSGGLSVGTR